MAEKLSRIAVATRGAVVAYLAPHLAADAKFNVTPLVRGCTLKQLRNTEQRNALAGSIVKAAQGKLAKDAVIDTKDLGKIMDVVGMLEGSEEGGSTDQMAPDPNATGATGGALSSAVGGSPSSSQMDKSMDGLTDEEEKEYQRLCAKRGNMDTKAHDNEEKEHGNDEHEDDKDKAEDEEEEDHKEKAEDEEESPLPSHGGKLISRAEGGVVGKKAMDAAIAKAADSTIARLNALETAKKEVFPLVGEVTGQFNHAHEIYAEALKARGVALDEMPRAGYGAMVRALVAQRDSHRRPTAANDSSMDARVAFDKAHGLTTRRVRHV